MAEFQEVAKHWKRMCNKYWRSTTCHGCPIAEHEGAYEACSGYDIDVAKMEEVVLGWAKGHPEPVYPSWEEYLCSIGFCSYNSLSEPVPEAIAKKLGIKPKEK